MKKQRSCLSIFQHTRSDLQYQQDLLNFLRPRVNPNLAKKIDAHLMEINNEISQLSTELAQAFMTSVPPAAMLQKAF